MTEARTEWATSAHPDSEMPYKHRPKSAVTVVGFRGAVVKLLHKHGLNLMLATTSLLIALVLIELIVRRVDPLGVSYYEEAYRYFTEATRSSPSRIYEHVPGYVGVFQGVEVSINSAGMRDAPLDLAEDDFIVLALGDSVTFGWGVSSDDIYVERLEKKLNENNVANNQHYEVVNFGVGGYNTSQELAFLVEQGLSLQPDLLFLLYVDNDLEPCNGQTAPSAGLTFEGVLSYTMGILKRSSWLVRLVDSQLRKVLPLSGQADSELRSACGWHESCSSLREIRRIASGLGVPFIVFHYTGLSADPSMHSQIAELLSQSAAEESFQFVELSPLAPTGDWRPLLNSPIDSHPNSEGHARLADLIYEALTMYGYVPQEH